MSNYIEVIKNKIPGLVIEKYCINNEGQNNDILIVNDSLIFKFPKYKEGIEKLKKEVSILEVLKRYISIGIPDIKYVNFDTNKTGFVFDGYEMIRGVPLRQNLFLEIQNKDIISNQLAVFLKELHNIPVKELDKCNITKSNGKDEWEVLFKKIQDKLFKYMRRECVEKVSFDFNTFLNAEHNYIETVIHGDFGGSNIIYDCKEQRISGIIDFNDIMIGDPAIDFAALTGPFGYGEDFIRSFEEVYHGIEELIGRARFYSSTFALQEALFGVEHNDRSAFDAGIKEFL